MIFKILYSLVVLVVLFFPSISKRKKEKKKKKKREKRGKITFFLDLFVEIFNVNRLIGRNVSSNQCHFLQLKTPTKPEPEK